MGGGVVGNCVRNSVVSELLLIVKKKKQKNQDGIIRCTGAS
uniref:Uncharacterized protein n=1 Tax=Candidatus Methanogaster sp. ANME-2c ERB4 TaxID=2759911 RepID=A0A7G9Y4L9_9EURY|nr:hypothetical protein KEEEGCAB_00001 [Methanosarcinales archaeon ANME-2c ERB4]